MYISPGFGQVVTLIREFLMTQRQKWAAIVIAGWFVFLHTYDRAKPLVESYVAAKAQPTAKKK